MNIARMVALPVRAARWVYRRKLVTPIVAGLVTFAILGLFGLQLTQLENVLTWKKFVTWGLISWFAFFVAVMFGPEQQPTPSEPPTPVNLHKQ